MTTINTPLATLRLLADANVRAGDARGDERRERTW